MVLFASKVGDYVSTHMGATSLKSKTFTKTGPYWDKSYFTLIITLIIYFQFVKLKHDNRPTMYIVILTTTATQ